MLKNAVSVHRTTATENGFPTRLRLLCAHELWIVAKFATFGPYRQFFLNLCSFMVSLWSGRATPPYWQDFYLQHRDLTAYKMLLFVDSWFSCRLSHRQDSSRAAHFGYKNIHSVPTGKFCSHRLQFEAARYLKAQNTSHSQTSFVNENLPCNISRKNPPDRISCSTP